MRGKINRSYLMLVPVGLMIVALFAVFVYATEHPLALFDTAGPIAEKERNLIYFALALSLLVVIPVFILLFAFAWKYRESNTTAAYQPELDGSRKAETVWWLIPSLLIFVLSIVTWNSSHALDPFRPLDSDVTPLTVQVVSLDWKWLFIYPDLGIATVNHLYIPTGTPINVRLTSDAPMNSFWVPQLAGQIYTMPGMETQLHMQADRIGEFRGQSANISGEGFADMVFTTHAMAPAAFAAWTDETRTVHTQLSRDRYDSLSQASTKTMPMAFGAVQDNLFDDILMKYMDPSMHTMHTAMPAMEARRI